MENKTDKLTKRVDTTQERILMHLKMKGKQPASLLAKSLGITNEGTRLHLLKLTEDGWISPESISKGVGRPTVVFSLTDKAQKRFPDTHAELTVQLLNSVKKMLGQEALDRLIEERERLSLEHYRRELESLSLLEDKLQRLVEIRSQEGYMAEWEKVDSDYFFIENHCPICAAASECQGFCRAELQSFRQALGSTVTIERTEHILHNGRRCAYKINLID
ncbi:helix-turn-helix transcriptional regulator [Flavobacterium kingsejongi]|nr:metalloregulator ArsR/SmtB family transcription factor [Flavobacterium kingsejongi]